MECFSFQAHTWVRDPRLYRYDIHDLLENPMKKSSKRGDKSLPYLLYNYYYGSEGVRRKWRSVDWNVDTVYYTTCAAERCKRGYTLNVTCGEHIL